MINVKEIFGYLNVFCIEFQSILAMHQTITFSTAISKFTIYFIYWPAPSDRDVAVSRVVRYFKHTQSKWAGLSSYLRHLIESIAHPRCDNTWLKILITRLLKHFVILLGARNTNISWCPGHKTYGNLHHGLVPDRICAFSSFREARWAIGYFLILASD